MASSKKRILTVIQIVMMLVVIGAVGWLGFKGYSYYSAAQYFDAFEQTYAQENAKGKFQVIWKKFQKDCPDAVAWLRVPGVDLSYPVMHGADNEFYLHHNPQGDYVFVGSVFMDCRNESVDDPHVILYGHNMIDGSMFGKLGKFRDASFAKKNSTIYMYTPSGRRTYQIFSVQSVSDTSEIFSVGFAHDEEFGRFVDTLQSGSMFSDNVEVDQSDSVLSLSTCETHSTRLVISAKLVESQK